MMQLEKHLLQESLRAGLKTLGLSLEDAQEVQLLSYLELIAKWNKVYNLTALRDPREMLTHHLLDSLAVIQPLQRMLQSLFPSKSCYRLLDVGSGAGLPGVVIAMVCPDVKVTCVDTVEKKTAFVRQVAVNLKLPNLRSIHARVESLSDDYDVVCSRAFASLHDFTSWSRTALTSQGVWMAMKGKYPDSELEDLPQDVRVFHVEHLQVPSLDADRCIVWMRG